MSQDKVDRILKVNEVPFKVKTSNVNGHVSIIGKRNIAGGEETVNLALVEFLCGTSKKNIINKYKVNTNK
jgi:hypothetical protein